ncbi:hypothetical protein Tco_1130400 [Tanacetum coccineum]
MIQPELEGSTRDIPLVRIEVHRYDTKGVKVRKGIMQTKTELTLEQTQQGVSDEVLIVIMDPVMRCTTSPATQGLSKDSCFISHRD